MGHIGFTPQFKKKFKVQGDTKNEANKLLKEAKNIEKAGAFSIVLECVNLKASKLITNSLKYQQLELDLQYIVMVKYL